MALSQHYIVELEFECWIAAWDGDPGRTTKIENAQRFDSLRKAENALNRARKYREFPSAFICPIRATVI